MPIDLEELTLLDFEPLVDFNESSKNLLLKIIDNRFFKQGTTLSLEDQKSGKFFFIRHGQMLVKVKVGEEYLVVKTIAEGEVFGILETALGVAEKSLLEVETDTECVVLESSDFFKFISKDKSAKKVWDEYIRQVRLRDEIRIHPFFRKLNMEELAEISRLLKKKDIPKGTILMEEGSPPTAMFFIQSGKFRITKSTMDPSFYSFVESGSVLGEMGIIEKKARSATVTAEVESIVYELTSLDALEFFQKSHSFFDVLKTVSQQRLLGTEVLDETKEEVKVEYDEPLFLPNSKARHRNKFNAHTESAGDQSAFLCRSMIMDYYLYDFLELENLENFPRYDAEIHWKMWKRSFSSFPVEVFRISWKRYINDLSHSPWIASLSNGSFVVVFQIDSNYAHIADPVLGNRKVSLKYLEKEVAPYAIYPVFLEDAPKSSSKFFSLFPGITKFLKSAWTFMLSGVVASFLIKSLQIGLPILNLYIIDSVLLKESKEHFNLVIFGIFIMTIAQIGLSYLRTNVLFYTSAKINQSIVIRFLEKLLAFPMTFFERNKKGEILQVWQELETVTQFIAEQGIVKLLDLIFGMVVVTLFIFLSPTLLGILFLLIIPELFILFRITPQLSLETRKEGIKVGETLSYFIESLHGHETIQNLGAMSVQRWDYEKRLTSQMNARGKRLYLESIMEAVSESFHLLTNVSIILAGAYMVLHHKITLGTLFAILGLMRYVREPLLSLTQDWYNFQRASIAWKKQGVWDNKEKEFNEDDRINLIEIPDIQGSIKISDLMFSYSKDGSDPILTKINLNIEPGERIAFVGRSGSGKSTILKVLLKFYEPDSGSIAIDGISLSEIWLPSYRSKVGVVFQDSSVLGGTIRENISLYRPEATLMEVVDAARSALLHEDIQKLPLGYDTDLLEFHFGLSGGQKQRLAFARLFLQKPALLLLDEPTSAMDKITEEKILKNLHSKIPNKTILTVAHRLETIKNYDKIFVMDHGQIIESGNHKELIERRGLYHLLYSRQESIR